MLKRAHSRRTRRLALPPRAPRAPPARPARLALRPRVPPPHAAKEGHRDRAALGVPLETAKGPNVSRETPVLKHQIVSRETFSASGCLEARRDRSRIASPARAPPVLRIRGAVGARARFYTGESAAQRPAASTRVRERRDALRLRCGRGRGVTPCGFDAGESAA